MSAGSVYSVNGTDVFDATEDKAVQGTSEEAETERYLRSVVAKDKKPLPLTIFRPAVVCGALNDDPIEEYFFKRLGPEYPADLPLFVPGRMVDEVKLEFEEYQVKKSQRNIYMCV